MHMVSSPGLPPHETEPRPQSSLVLFPSPPKLGSFFTFFCCSTMGKSAGSCISVLVTLLAAPTVHVRGRAVRCLGALGSRAKHAHPQICALLTDPSACVRESAIEALAFLSSSLADIPLRALLNGHLSGQMILSRFANIEISLLSELLNIGSDYFVLGFCLPLTYVLL